MTSFTGPELYDSIRNNITVDPVYSERVGAAKVFTKAGFSL